MGEDLKLQSDVEQASVETLQTAAGLVIGELATIDLQECRVEDSAIQIQGRSAVAAETESEGTLCAWAVF